MVEKHAIYGLEVFLRLILYIKTYGKDWPYNQNLALACFGWFWVDNFGREAL